MEILIRLRLGAPIKVLVSSSEDIPHLVYVIISHGNIIQMQHIKLPAKPKSYTIHLKPSIEMMPISYIHVHYSHDDIFRHEEMELILPKEFENKISLKAPKETKPGQEITLEINAQPQSIIGLLAVDLGVHLLDPSYDLQRDYIMNELIEDKSYIYSEYIENREYLISGLIILTNIKREVLDTIPKKPIRETDEGPQEYRTQFPEVWIFQNVEINSTNTKMTFKLPDSITSWRITAFSVNEKTGFGIVDAPTDIVAMKPFFISLNLPYSVKWGEIVAIPVLVFNYHTQSLDSVILMLNEKQEFEFMESPQDLTRKCKKQQSRSIKSNINANDGQMFTFYIKPSKVGYIDLCITASNMLSTDAIQQQLKVEPEGVTQNINQAVYLNSTNDYQNGSSTSLEVQTPSNVEPSTNEISLSVGADYLVPTLENLRNLIELPTGCGEQNMIHFAPNILVLQYLKTTGDYAKEKQLVDTIKSYTDTGYQTQLSYRHDNGGYSVFGQSVDEEASTWLTAYTVRFFIKASKFTAIESRIIQTGLEYLAKTQLPDGSFPYTGYLFNPAQQNPHGLTAFILATFLEDRMCARRYQQVVNDGLQFLIKDLKNIVAYALSIIAFVLQMANDPNVKEVMQKLHVYRKEKEGYTWWSDENSFNENNVEITSYTLMALLDSSSSSASAQMPVLKWLLKQRNDKGGFLSTQDTVVGLQALVMFNQKAIEEKNISLTIKYTAKNEKGEELKRGEFKIKTENSMTTQKQELPKSTRNVGIEISGKGAALLQLSHQYKLLDAVTDLTSLVSSHPKSRRKNDVGNSSKTDDVIYFIIKPNPNILKNNDLQLEICFIYTSKSNMVIMEVNLPSGYRTDDEALEDLKNYFFVQRIESKKNFTTIIFYLGQLPEKVENCITVLAYTTSDVFARRSAAVAMYDYYNTNNHNLKFYHV